MPMVSSISLDFIDWISNRANDRLGTRNAVITRLNTPAELPLYSIRRAGAKRKVDKIREKRGYLTRIVPRIRSNE